MGVLIAIFFLIILSLQVFISWVLVKKLRIDLRLGPKEEPKVSDPFQKPKEIYTSTTHIIVPKTPTEIRNQNFKKIQEGIEYGDIKKEE